MREVFGLSRYRYTLCSPRPRLRHRRYLSVHGGLTSFGVRVRGDRVAVFLLEIGVYYAVKNARLCKLQTLMSVVRVQRNRKKSSCAIAKKY